MSFIAVYVTHPNKDVAEKIVEHLLDERLIACANYLPIRSAYYWNEKMENASEVITLLKTRKQNWDALKEEIMKMHPYKIPCIMKFNVEANAEYEKWIEDEAIG